MTSFIILDDRNIKHMKTNQKILPGFSITLGFSVFYLCLIVIIPLAGLFLKSAGIGWDSFYQIVSAPRVLSAFKLSFGCAFIAAVINAFFGLLTAWVLVRYSFFGKRIVDALVDLPFAMPTAVAGIALTTLYAENGWIGEHLAAFGIKAAFNPLGIIIALTFVGLPFVVRTVQPILQDIDAEVEEAAASLGATRSQCFLKVVLPSITPALLTGFTLAFARGIGEYGSVIFIAGNIPMKSEIIPLLIAIKLEQFDYTGACAIALVMLLASFFLLFAINLIQRWHAARSM